MTETIVKYPEGAIKSLDELKGHFQRAQAGESVCIIKVKCHGFGGPRIFQVPLSANGKLHSASLANGLGLHILFRVYNMDGVDTIQSPSMAENFLFTNYFHAWGHYCRCLNEMDN